MAITERTEIRTERLILRQWRDADRSPFADMSADPSVMRYLRPVLTPEESDAVATRLAATLERRGFGKWVVEVPGVTPFAGYVGLADVLFRAHFTPAVEIGWRLAAPYWGRGYASEAARAVLDAGFSRFDLPEIVSFTVPDNHRSRRVMERLGMHHDPRDDFEHPGVSEPLRHHVLYRLSREEWRNS